jgi:hypothetical protein
MVLRLADRGRSSSLSFNRRRTGLPPSESVSSCYPSWICERRSCSVSVSFGRRLAAFFFAIFHVHTALPQGRRESYLSTSPSRITGTPLGNRRHTAARAETTGYARACRRAFDSQPRGRSGSAVWCPARRRCALIARFRKWSARRPSVSISNKKAGRSIRSGISKDPDCTICPCSRIDSQATEWHKASHNPPSGVDS